jgi:hypothetical protein
MKRKINLDHSSSKLLHRKVVKSSNTELDKITNDNNYKVV